MGSLSRMLEIARLESCKQFQRVACLLGVILTVRIV